MISCARTALTLFAALPVLIVSSGACLPRGNPIDPVPAVLLAIALAPRGECVTAGLSGSVASSGILVCMAQTNYQCGSNLTFSTAAQRTALTSEITALASAYPACSTAVTNALTEINALTLPANLLLNRAGGTAGPHVVSNYAAFSVSSCAAYGLGSASFLSGASRLASQSEMEFLSSARGLVAIKDVSGTCRSQLLGNAENTVAQSIISGNATRFAVCDYGADDAAKADCPGALQRSDLQFSGISGW